MIANRTLLVGSVNDALVYHPFFVGAGEWWRLISYPLVHLSWYHLLLDVGAFYLLYTGMTEKRHWRKLLMIAACSAGSLFFGVWLGEAQNLGLAGLSGIDHGLMAFSALQMMQTAAHRELGLACFVLVIGKSVYELATGQVLFLALHTDLCGTPIAASHAGGVLAGLLVFWLFDAMKVHENGDVQC
jgi:rhomboid family GlyGly-CTERM serine protease